MFISSGNILKLQSYRIIMLMCPINSFVSTYHFYLFASCRGAKIAIFAYVCMSVCLPVFLSICLHVHPHIFSGAVLAHARSFASSTRMLSSYTIYHISPIIIFNKKADRTARRQFQATGQPVSRTQASGAMTSRLPRYEAKCV